MPKKIVILDFDQTITKKHTFKNRSLIPEKNIKSGVSTIITTDNPIIAIATYHDDPQYIMAYLTHILAIQEDTPVSIHTIPKKHDLLTVYQYEGMAPILISTVKDENNQYKIHQRLLSRTGKNTQIEHIFEELSNFNCLDDKENEVDFYDDSKSNFLNAKNKLKNIIPASVTKFIAHHIDADNSDFNIIDSFSVLDSKPIKVKDEVIETYSSNPLNQSQRDIPLYYNQLSLSDDNSINGSNNNLSNYFLFSLKSDGFNLNINNLNLSDSSSSHSTDNDFSTFSFRNMNIERQSLDSLNISEEIFVSDNPFIQEEYCNLNGLTILDNTDSNSDNNVPSVHGNSLPIKRYREQLGNNNDNLDNCIDNNEPKRKQQRTSRSVSGLSLFNTNKEEMSLSESTKNHNNSWG